jgi:hypothetical protein
MLAHATLIDGERDSRAKRLHSIELDRHSAAESMDHTHLDAKSTPCHIEYGRLL